MRFLALGSLFFFVSLPSFAAVNVSSRCLPQSVQNLFYENFQTGDASLSLATHEKVVEAVAQVSQNPERAKQLVDVDWAHPERFKLSDARLAEIESSAWRKKLTSDSINVTNLMKLAAHDVGLTLFETEMLNLYTGSGFDVINKAIRTNHIQKVFWSPVGRYATINLSEDELRMMLKEFPLVLNSALAKLKAVETTVKRIANLNPDIQGKLKKGRIFSFQTYTSTTAGDVPPVVKSSDWTTQNTMFVLKQKSGRSIVNFSRYKSEQEVILYPHRPFLVTRTELDAPSGVTTIYATEI